MKELRIDRSLFKGEESANLFVEEIRRILKEANGNLVPIYNDGRLLGYAVAPDSPYWKDLVSREA